MIIELATKEDIPHLGELLSLLFEQENQFEVDIEAHIRGLNKIIDSKTKGIVLVAKIDQKVVGMANLLYSISTAIGEEVAHLDDLIVHPDHRSNGIGSELMQAAEIKARESGCARITLYTARDNQHARALYEKNAFLGSTMILYTKMLKKKK